MPDPRDRTVHAITRNGCEIVRYDRAGQWFLEWPVGSMVPCRHVGVNEAARTAVEDGGDIRLDLPGGTVFDRRVRKLREEAATDTPRESRGTVKARRRQ